MLCQGEGTRMTQTGEPEPPGDRVATLCELASSLIALQDLIPGLSVDESTCITQAGEVVEPEKGVAALYRPDGCQVEVRILVSHRRAKFVTRTFDQPDAWTELEDRLVVTLGETPTFLGRHFASTDELASALVGVARRRAADAVLSPRSLGRPAEDGRVRSTNRGARRMQRPTAGHPARAGLVP